MASAIMAAADSRARAPSASSADAATAQPSSYVRRNRYSALVRRTKRETDMPEIYVHAVKGRSLDQKRALIKDITDAVVKNFSVPAEAVMVEIVESEPTAKAKGGVLFSEMRR
jgi:4-oxalocrotonate tautomerase